MCMFLSLQFHFQSCQFWTSIVQVLIQVCRNLNLRLTGACCAFHEAFSKVCYYLDNVCLSLTKLTVIKLPKIGHIANRTRSLLYILNTFMVFHFDSLLPTTLLLALYIYSIMHDVSV